MPTNQNPQLLDVDPAYAVVQQKWYLPIFREKLARDYGIVPSDDQELFEIMTMASQLRQAYDLRQKAAAAGQTSKLAGARAHLQQVLAQAGVPVQDGTTSMIKSAAARGATDPELANAILSMQVHGSGLATAA